MSDKIPLLYCSNSNYIIGGVEIFNKNLESSFKEYNLKYEVIYKLNYLQKFQILREIFSLFKLIFISKRLKFDFLLVHHSSFFSILVLPFLSLFFKDIKTLCHVGTEWKHIRQRLYRSITIFFLKNFSTKTFVISDHQISFLPGVKLEKISSIIPRNFITNKKVNDNNEKYILFLSRVCKEKGIIDLLNLYEKFHDELPVIKICGPISGDKIQSLIENKIQKCCGKIILIDPVYDIDDKIKLIDNSIFGIYPSYYDAFPLTPIEFFSRGKICITSNISESINFIKDPNLLVSPGNINEIKDSIVYSLKLINEQKLNHFIQNTIDNALEIASGKIVYDIIK